MSVECTHIGASTAIGRRLGHPIDRVLDQQPLIWVGVEIIRRVETTGEVNDSALPISMSDHAGNLIVSSSGLQRKVPTT